MAKSNDDDWDDVPQPPANNHRGKEHKKENIICVKINFNFIYFMAFRR